MMTQYQEMSECILLRNEFLKQIGNYEAKEMEIQIDWDATVIDTGPELIKKMRFS